MTLKGGLNHVDSDRQRLLFRAHRLRGALGTDKETRENLGGLAPSMNACPVSTAPRCPQRGFPFMKGLTALVHGGEVIYTRTVYDNPAQVHAVAAAARVCLHSSPYTTLRGVSCECRHGVLFLTGRLSSFHQKQIAQEAVARVQGVTQVVNQIEVGRADEAGSNATSSLPRAEWATRRG